MRFYIAWVTQNLSNLDKTPLPAGYGFASLHVGGDFTSLSLRRSQMMTVADLPVTILNDAELLDLARRVSAAIANSHPEHSWFGRIVEQLNSQIQEMNTVRNRQTANDLTEDIRKADEHRDKAYLAFRAGLEFREFSDDPNQATAATNLLQLLRRRDYSLQALSNREQTVELTALLNDLSDSSAQDDLSTVGLVAEAETLSQTQKAFDELVDQRAADEASRQLPPLRTARGLLREDLTVTVVSLNFAERDDPETFTSLAEAVSEHIMEVVANARARRTRNDAEEARAEGASSTEDFAPVVG
ncbi:MAG: hypothetical protein KDB27_10595 [Planctomycetales bacterium]|nr:hypothetical protein [Planctomycetales bacterium]